MRNRHSCVFFVFILIIALNAFAKTDSVTILGTASMLRLCQSLVSMYSSQVPGSSVGVNVSDSVQSLPEGGNSIWETVHPLDKEQKQQLEQRFGSTPREIPIAIEGTVVITNRSNPVNDLSMDQLRAIYSGSVRNWKEVGGQDGQIRLYSTESMVGGSLYFTALVLHGGDIDTTMRGYVNPKETEMAVAQDPKGIGLIPLPAGTDVKYPRIHRSTGSPGIDATNENVRTLRYPLSSYVYWIVADRHSDAITQLVEFTLSSKGQLAAEAGGYYPLNPTDRIAAIASTTGASAGQSPRRN